MGKSSPKAPAPIDPVATAQAQGAANKEAVLESAKVNQINQITPWGSLTYSGAVGAPDRTQTVTLDPADQAQLEKQRQLTAQLTGFAEKQLPQIGQNFSTPLDFSGLPSLEALSPEVQNTATKAAFDRAYGLLAPELEKQDRQLQTMLANRGIPEGSEAYTDAAGRFDRSRAQQLTDLANAAVGVGQQAQAQQFGQTQAQRQQGINETLTQRSQPLNELAALIQGAPAIGTPQFNQPASYGVQPADVMGAMALNQQGRWNAYNAAMQQQNAMLGGLFGLGGAALVGRPWK